MKQDKDKQAEREEIQQIFNQIRMAGEQVRQNISTAKDAQVEKLMESYQEDIAFQAAQARQQDALLRQLEKAVEDGDFDKMLEIKTLLGQRKE
ncbi:hypothetical protein [Faecalibacterium sp. An192]|uniref:hypothetical protein n=1 Tax=Faecalibacterium sp. An192 TaxID=1965581 RepID=UPI000B397D0A|nr:hypothetical protein [Faecalibacterium sp. An192]OUP26146.1 hypothetical protein B5F27_14570 [Faecalibacterium sp. An192]